MTKKKEFNPINLVSFFLRIGLATVFLYAGISAFLNPTVWIGFIPSWVTDIFPGTILLFAHATFDVLLALWLLFGKKVFYASIAAGLMLLTIIIFNVGALDIVFRDIAILFAAVALAILHFKEVKKK